MNLIEKLAWKSAKENSHPDINRHDNYANGFQEGFRKCREMVLGEMFRDKLYHFLTYDRIKELGEEEV